MHQRIGKLMQLLRDPKLVILKAPKLMMLEGPKLRLSKTPEQMLQKVRTLMLMLLKVPELLLLTWHLLCFRPSAARLPPPPAPSQQVPRSRWGSDSGGQSEANGNLSTAISRHVDIH